MAKVKQVESGLSKLKIYLLLCLGVIILIGSGVLFWQIERQSGEANKDENIALKNQIDDLNKKIEDLNKAIEQAKNSSPTIQTKSYSTSSGKVAGEQNIRTEGKININSASLSQLDSLPGIGSTYAQRIIDYRQANGGFKNIEEIKNVKGIGDKTFEKFRDLITI